MNFKKPGILHLKKAFSHKIVFVLTFRVVPEQSNLVYELLTSFG
jgi:hypothetical protein